MPIPHLIYALNCKFAARLFVIVFNMIIATTVLAQTDETPSFDSASQLDQHLNLLYQNVKDRFENNPHFKNSANPRLFLPAYSYNSLPPEFTMPSLDTFKVAMKSYCSLLESSYASKISNPNHFAIMDYSASSLVRRFYIYDIQKKEFTHNTWSTHAQNSNFSRYQTLEEIGIEGEYAFKIFNSKTSHFFSNRPGSNLSSLGMAIALSEPYDSTVFESKALRLRGVDSNLNSNLIERAIVIHAWDITSEMIRYTQTLPTSDGCLMFGRDDFFEGNDHTSVSDFMIKELTGSPILLYHERLSHPELNELQKQEDLNRYAKLQTEMVIHLGELSKSYQWSDAQLKTYTDIYTKHLKEQTYDLIMETYDYFKGASKFIGKTPKSEDQCMNRLGI